MSLKFPIPETKVLAIASHVVYGYVGNTMATFVMQSLGCEVAALNTVQFSNHLGYGMAKGTKATADEIKDLYQGLKDAYLDEFDMLLSGYLSGAASVEALGTIARGLKLKANLKPGSFFWVLDPVMGDNGKLYVADDVVPAYKNLIRDADLILPNQFEAETLSGVKIVDRETLKEAVSTLHEQYLVPHIIITSIILPSPGAEPSLFVLGSTITSMTKPRMFLIKVPRLDCFFSGTGDMFASLILVRLREAVLQREGLLHKTSWISGDEVEAEDLPLAMAAERVLASIHEVLIRTKEKRDQALQGYDSMPMSSEDEDKRRLVACKAAEVGLIRNRRYLEAPRVKFKSEKV